MRIACPYCGDRDQGEFVYLGDATVLRPDPAARDAASAFQDYVYLRENPAGWHREYWYHEQGCRSWLVVERNTLTHEIRSVTLCRPTQDSGSAHNGSGADTEAGQ
ncbi:MAG: sarcosine oxidase subunit delta [Pseudomonadota bacterium]